MRPASCRSPSKPTCLNQGPPSGFNLARPLSILKVNTRAAQQAKTAAISSADRTPSRQGQRAIARNVDTTQAAHRCCRSVAKALAGCWPSSTPRPSDNRCVHGSKGEKHHPPRTPLIAHSIDCLPRVAEQTVDDCCCHSGWSPAQWQAAPARRRRALASRSARRHAARISWFFAVGAVDQQLLQFSAFTGQRLATANPLTGRGIAAA